MNQDIIFNALFTKALFVICLIISKPTEGQDNIIKYSTMSPVEEYLMDRQTEIDLARTSAPESITRNAEVLVLGRQGYETAIKGKNGFVCIVGRGWSSAVEPDFWNPNVRVPMCLNAPAARSYLMTIREITDLALAGNNLLQVNKAMANAFAKKKLPAMEPGSMCYMTGKEGYGGDVIPHWPPHLMFFYTDVDPAIWGANEKLSPVLGITDSITKLTQFVIPVEYYSDGTPASKVSSEHKHGESLTELELKLKFQEIEDSLNQAVIFKDIDLIKKYITSDWVLVDAQGGIIPQQRFLSVLEEGLLAHTTMTKHIQRVKIYGDIALVTSRGQHTETSEGKTVEVDEWVTDVYKKVNGKWLCVLTRI